MPMLEALNVSTLETRCFLAFSLSRVFLLQVVLCVASGEARILKESSPSEVLREQDAWPKDCGHGGESHR